jgi:protein subunit release factor A
LSVPQELKEVNQNLEEMHTHNQELQRVQQAADTAQLMPHHSPDRQEKQHLTVELSELKAKMRKLRQEL